jgi:two-component sensor histidine kinase
MTIRSCLLLLGWWLTYPLMAQPNTADSLSRRLALATQPDTLRVRLLIQLVQTLPLSTETLTRRIGLANEAVTLARRVGDAHWQSRAYLTRAKLNFAQSRQAETLRDADSARLFGAQANRPADGAEGLHLLAVANLTAGNFPLTLDYFQRAERLARQTTDRAFLAKLLYNKSLYYQRTADTTRMLRCYDEIERTGANPDVLAFAYHGRLIHYYDTQRYAECVRAARQLEKTALFATRPTVKAQTLSRLGLSTWWLTRSKPRAEAIIRQAVAVADASGDNIAKVDAYWSLAELHTLAGDYPRAEAVYDQIEAEVLQSQRADQALRLWKARSQLSGKRGDYKAAYQYQQRYNQLGDSLFLAQKQAEIRQLETSYLAKQKQARIDQLAQQAKLTETETQRANMQRNAVLAGLLAVLSVAIGLWVRYRMSRDNLRVVSAQRDAIAARDHEKALLLREMHHRTKNQLQLIMSLFGTQTYRESDEKLRQLFRENRDRTFAVALLHDQLYQQTDTTDTRRVVLRPYLTALLDHLRDSMGRPGITLIADLADATLDVQAVVPLGLIVAEAVTNAYKYAFDATQGGQIQLCFGPTEAGYRLLITDTGRGLSGNVPQPGFGLTLISDLVEQLGGTLTVDTTSGFRLIVTLPQTPAL